MKNITLFLSLFLFAISCYAQTDSVYYHHGTFTSQYGSSGSVPSADFYRYVTRFTPPYYPARLVGMKAWFRNAANPSSFKWVIYKDSSGAALGPQSNPDFISPVEINNPASGGIQDSAYGYYTDFSAQNIVLNAGDIYAGVTQHPATNGFLGIAIDTSNAFTTDRPWVYYGVWTQMINWVFMNGEWGLTAYFTPVPNGMGKINNSDISLSVYPDPVNDVAFLKYDSKDNSSVSITLFDATGNEVMVIIDNEQKAAGNNSIRVNIQNLPIGIYFVRVQSQYNCRVSRIVKL